MFDTNAFAGHWPFDRLSAQTPAELEAHLKSAGITAACAYPVEAVFYPDPQVANDEFLETVKGSPFFVPSGVVDPTLANWREVVAELQERWDVPMVRLFPAYHQYSLSDGCAGDLLAFAAERNLVTAIHIRLQDERRHHPLMKVPPVPIADIVAATIAHPETKILVCCALIREARQLYSNAGPERNVYVEISNIEYVSTLEHLLKDVPLSRVVLGTHAPLYYPHAGVAKIEDAPLPAGQLDAIREGNAARLLKR